MGVVAMISGILAQFLIASSFGVDAFGAVLFSVCLAARRLQATVRLGARYIGWRADRCGGSAHVGNNSRLPGWVAQVCSAGEVHAHRAVGNRSETQVESVESMALVQQSVPLRSFI